MRFGTVIYEIKRHLAASAPDILYRYPTYRLRLWDPLAFYSDCLPRLPGYLETWVPGGGGFATH